jgi:hypothetical protein
MAHTGRVAGTMAQMWLEYVPRDACVRNLSPRVVMLRSGGSFKSWSIVGGCQVTGTLPLEGSSGEPWIVHSRVGCYKGLTPESLSGILFYPCRHSPHCDAICHETLTKGQMDGAA